MASQIPNNTNIKDIIRSAIKDIKDSTDIIKMIVGELKSISSIVPTDIDKYCSDINIVTNAVDDYIELIQKISGIGKIDFKEFKTSYKNITSASQYVRAIAEMMNDLSEINNQYDIEYKNLEKLTKLIDNTIGSISNINSLNRINIGQIINIKLYLIEYEWLVSKLLVINDRLSKRSINALDVDVLANNISGMYNIIDIFDNNSIKKLLTANVKTILLNVVINDILNSIREIDKKLAGKSFTKNLKTANDNLQVVITISESLTTILNEFKMMSKYSSTLKTTNAILNLITPIIDSIITISEKLKNIEIDNGNINRVVEFTKQMVRIEKSVILMGILAAPFAAAAVISLVFITIGILALQALMRIILFVSNPVIIRAVAISIRRLAGVMLMIALTIASLALTVAIILIAHEMITNNLRQILETVLCIGLVLLSVIALGWLMTISSPLLIAAMAGMLFVGMSLLAIMGVALLLKEIPKYGFDNEQQAAIKGAINSIMSTVHDVVDTIFGSFDEEMGSKKGKWGDDGLILTVGSWILGDTIINLMKIILMSSMLVFTIISVALVKLTAMTLRLIKNEEFDAKGIKEKTATIMSTARDVISSIFESFDRPISDQHDGVLVGLSSWLLGDTFTNMVKLVLACAALTFTTIAVSLVKLTAMSLNMISTTEIDAGKIGNNTSIIMSTAKSVIAAVNAPVDPIYSNEKSWGREVVEWIMPSGLLNMVDSIMAIGSLVPTLIAVGAVRFLAESINTISNVTINTNVEKKAQDIVLMGSKLVKLINDQDSFGIIDNAKAIKRISILKDLGNVLANFSKDIKVQEHEKLMNSTIKFIDTINNAKLENLQTTHKLFKEMKEFSESISGNFEGLANALNEKIAPLLEELKEMIGKIPESVKDSATTVSGSVYTAAAWQGGTATPFSMEEQIKRENPSMSKEDVNKMVDERMTQQSQSIYKGMEMKIEEILSALQNYSNPIPVRMS